MTSVEYSIHLLRSAERLALKINPEGFHLAFSGGKDSIVLHHIAERAGVKFKAYFINTGLEHPALYKFIKENYSVTWIPPEVTMWKLIEQKQQLPSRWARYCCEKLKERKYLRREQLVITGIRSAESPRRAKREDYEIVCKRGRNEIMIHPIFHWSDKLVWHYIRENNLKYPALYDEGYSRLGCVGCPMSPENARRDLEKYPVYKKLWLRACSRLIELGKYSAFINAENLLDWYTTRTGKYNQVAEDSRLW